MIKYIAAIIIICTSCSQVEPQELQVLQKIINRDFNNCPTYHKLIPIKVQLLKEYNQYKKEVNQFADPKHPRIPESPLPPNLNPRNSVPIGVLPFSKLIRNSQISEIQYEKLIKKCNLIEGKTDEIHINQVVEENFHRIMASKSVDKYQEFGYPILIDDTLVIIYRNIYNGIQSSDNLGLIGNGTYFIYSKNGQEWILMDKITKWIT